mmetsp:Transcript_12952/g.20277  ORF Transcript_12952/g.20277 Transcript_12952/m.20277 type:complete len:226 (-) Transcript_12952:418-1095(-)
MHQVDQYTHLRYQKARVMYTVQAQLSPTPGEPEVIDHVHSALHLFYRCRFHLPQVLTALVISQCLVTEPRRPAFSAVLAQRSHPLPPRRRHHRGVWHQGPEPHKQRARGHGVRRSVDARQRALLPVLDHIHIGSGCREYVKGVHAMVPGQEVRLEACQKGRHPPVVRLPAHGQRVWPPVLKEAELHSRRVPLMPQEVRAFVDHFGARTGDTRVLELPIELTDEGH